MIAQLGILKAAYLTMVRSIGYHTQDFSRHRCSGRNELVDDGCGILQIAGLGSSRSTASFFETGNLKNSRLYK